MRLKRKLMAVLTTAAIATGVVVVEATPAFAGFEGCGPGYLCVYETSFGTGYSASLGPYAPGGCYPLNGWWNDRVRSVWNRNNRRVTFHKHANCSSANEQPQWPVIIYIDVQKVLEPESSSFYIWYS